MSVTLSSLLYPLAAMATTMTAATLYVYKANPVRLVRFFLWTSVKLSGMKIKTTMVEGLRLVYGERGRKQMGRSSILLLHGFSADKSMWAPLCRHLPPDLHVIALDLPGHGESQEPSIDADLSLSAQMEFLHKTIETLGLATDPIHLVGLSMGGALAGLYAAEYPQNVERLTMMCPAMKTPVATEISLKIRQIMESGDEEKIFKECPLIPRNAEEMQYMLDFAQFHKSSFIPKQILEGAVEMRRPYNQYYLRLFKNLANLKNSQILQNTAHRIKVPTHLVWGEDDQVIHISGAEVLRQILPNCQQVDIIPRCGHAINLDRPGSKTKALLKFRGELHLARNKQ
ncbi:hypothetical protein FSP39_000075 [Pinctada imbricata]|uniref:acylglycerol lipase n=1 Tax=Pinctada imbricata TaxID=66713 RepID=A0AA89C4K8_PINIB|nr:hypothetical protein FSP39_000075 [Pinctada imbricata]